MDREARQPLRGLRAEDFTIIQGGRARSIVAFASETDLGAGARLVIIVIDSSIPPKHRSHALRVAQADLELLRPGEQAAIVTVNRTFSDVAFDVTDDRTRLNAAIDRAFASLPSSTGRLMEIASGDCACGSCVSEAILRAAERIRERADFRKVVHFIGPYFRDARDVPRGAKCSAAVGAAQRAIDQAKAEANLTIEEFDPAMSGSPVMAFMEDQYVFAFEPSSPISGRQSAIRVNVKHPHGAVRWSWRFLPAAAGR